MKKLAKHLGCSLACIALLCSLSACQNSSTTRQKPTKPETSKRIKKTTESSSEKSTDSSEEEKLFVFDAQKYVQATLDITQGKFDDYAKITKIPESEAQELYEKNISIGLEEFAEAGVPEQLYEQYQAVFKEMYKLTKYSVGSATKSGTGYTVPVEIEPLLIFDGLQAEIEVFSGQLTEEYTNHILNGGAEPSEAEITNRLAEHLYNLINGRIQNPTYGEKKTMEISVYLDFPEGAYTISDEQLEEMFDSLTDLS